MAGDLDLKIRISAELGEIKGALAGLQKQMVDVGNASKKASTDGSAGFEGMRRSLDGIKSSVVGLAASIGVAFSVKAVADMADQMKTLEGRLRLVTKSQDELIGLQTELYNLSQRTRGGLEGTVEMYARLARSTQDTTATQGQLLRVTETINKAVQVSGASATEAQAAIIQLSQGLASGALRGDELRSVLEQMPRLATAIAQGMGKSVGELRSLGEAGKLTTEQIINALLQQSGKIDEEFQKMPLTISGSLTELHNSFQLLVGQLDSASGASGSLAGQIKALADYVGSGQLAAAFLQQFGEISGVISATVNDVTDIVATLKSDISGIGDAFGIPEGSVLSFDETFTHFAANARALIKLVITEAEVMVLRIVEGLNAIGGLVKAAFTSETVDDVRNKLKEARANIESFRDEQIDGILKERDAHIAAGKAAKDRFETEQKKRAELASKLQEQAAAANADVKRTGGVTGTADGLKIQQADAQQAIQALDQVYALGKTRLEDYYADKKRLSSELGAIEVQEAERAVKSATNSQDMDKALTALELAKRKASALSANIEAEERTARQKRDLEIRSDTERLQVDLAKIEGRNLDARNLEIETKYRTMLERIKLAGDTEGPKIIEALINKERVKAQLDDIEAKFKKTLNDLKSLEDSLANRVRVGEMTPSEADARLKAARAESRGTLGGLLGQANAIGAQNPNDTGIQDQIKGLDSDYEKTKESATGLAKAQGELNQSLKDLHDNLATDVVNAGVSGLTKMFTDIVTGSKSAKEALVDFVRSFAQTMLEIASRALATYLVLTTLDAIYPGLGKAAAATMGVTSNHNGGLAGSGPITHYVNPAIFAAAPRYHTGGIAGLKPGEVPAILQQGEEVLTRKDPRHVANGGGAGGGGTRVINVIDPNMVSDYMSSSNGEQVLLNVLQRNSGMIKQVLT